MAEFNIDDVLSEFGSKPTAKKASGSFDVDSILSQFGVKADEKPSASIPRVIIDTTPKPPISGISKEASDELNQTRVDKIGGENPRASLPTTSILDSMAEHGIAAKDLMKSGAEDLGSGHPYKGAGKVALGALAAVTSPVTGAVEGGPTKLADQLFPKGNQDIPRYPDPIYGTPTGMPKENIASTGDRAGFVVGSAIPVVPGGGAIVKALPKNKALKTLVESIGPENLPAVVQQLKANPRLAPADLSPKVLQDAQHLFANDGPQINYLANTSAERMASRKGTINDAYNTAGGPSVDLVQKIQGLADAAKKVGSEKINPALAAAKPVNVSSTVDAIDKILKPGVNSVISEGSSLPLTAVKKELAQIKTMLVNDKEMRTGAQDLHKFQSGLRRTADSLLKSASGADREMGNALMNVRNNLVSDIDKASPKIKITENGVEKEVGSYKHSLSGYRDEMHIADAFKQGHDNIFTSSKKIENDPSFTKKWFDGLTEHEQQAAKEGARAAIYTEMGVAKNGALAGESVARSDFNKAKMEILFGKEEAAKLLNKLEAERAIANTHNKIVEGSQTAMRAASKQQFALPTATEVMRSAPAVAASEASNYFLGGMPGVGTALLGAAKAGAMTKDAVKMKLAREHNFRYAKYALPTEGPSRDELIRGLESYIPGPKKSMLSRASTVASKIIP